MGESRKVQKTAVVPAVEPKSGFKTSEFWVTIATVLGSIFASVQSSLPDDWKIAAVVCGAIAAAAYSVSRALVKK